MSAAVPTQVMNTKPLFRLMVEKKASDLFFTCNAPVKIKIEGKIFPVNKQILSPETVRQAALGLMTQEQIDYFNEELEIDFAISESGLGRFRVNVFYQRGFPAMVLRYITAEMPKLDELGMPDIFKGEVAKIKEVMARSNRLGMKTFDQALFELYEAGIISYEDALRNADSKNELRLRVKLESKREMKSPDDGSQSLEILEEEEGKVF